MSEQHNRHYFRARAHTEMRRELTRQLSPPEPLLNGIDISQQSPFQNYAPVEEQVDPEILEKMVSDGRMLSASDSRNFGMHIISEQDYSLEEVEEEILFGEGPEGRRGFWESVEYQA